MRWIGQDFNEVFSFAMEGLHDAAKTWDESRGIPFGTYASLRIRWRISRGLHYRLAEKRGGKSTTLSLDEQLNGADGSDGRTRGDLLRDEFAESPSDAIGDREEYALLHSYLKQLPNSRDTRILKERFGFYGEAQTLEEIGQRHKLTRERIRQIEEKCLVKLAVLFKSGETEIFLSTVREDQVLAVVVKPKKRRCGKCRKPLRSHGAVKNGRQKFMCSTCRKVFVRIIDEHA